MSGWPARHHTGTSSAPHVVRPATHWHHPGHTVSMCIPLLIIVASFAAMKRVAALSIACTQDSRSGGDDWLRMRTYTTQMTDHATAHTQLLKAPALRVQAHVSLRPT